MADGKAHKVEARVRELATPPDDKQIAEMVQVFCGAHTGLAGRTRSEWTHRFELALDRHQHTTPQTRLPS